MATDTAWGESGSGRPRSSSSTRSPQRCSRPAARGYVLPASYRVDFDQLRIATGAKKVEISKEIEFKDKFPGCELGAMPPFGNLYGMEVYVAKSLAEDEEIAFNACSHTELIRMKYEDYDRLVRPKILKFSKKIHMH